MRAELIFAMVVTAAGSIIISASTYRNYSVNHSEKKMIVSKLANIYPDYLLDNISLTYTDWSSTVREVDEDQIPTDTEVTISNKDET